MNIILLLLSISFVVAGGWGLSSLPQYGLPFERTGSPSVAVIPGLVTRSGPDLARDGGRFVPKGINYYAKDCSWFCFWDEYESFLGQIEHELDLASGLGINAIRIFLPYNRFDSTAGNNRNLNNLDHFLGLLKNRGMVAIVTLFDFYPSQATSPPYSPQDYENSKRHIDAVINKIGTANPTVLGWDIKTK